MQEQPVGLETMGENQFHLFRYFFPRIGAVADDPSITGKEHLSHEDPIDPHLMFGPDAMPEPAV